MAKLPSHTKYTFPVCILTFCTMRALLPHTATSNIVGQEELGPSESVPIYGICIASWCTDDLFTHRHWLSFRNRKKNKQKCGELWKLGITRSQEQMQCPLLTWERSQLSNGHHFKKGNREILKCWWESILLIYIHSVKCDFHFWQLKNASNRDVIVVYRGKKLSHRTVFEE